MIFYFENDPAVELEKEARMMHVARNMTLTVSKSAMEQAGEDMCMRVEGRHPYPFRSTLISAAAGVVNVFNCKQIFNEFCTAALGSSVSPKIELYTYSFVPAELKGQRRKVLSEVRYPSPNGWQKLTASDVAAFWRGVDIGSVFDPSRSKSKTMSEKDDMCFVYAAVVQLREQGLLDRHNTVPRDPTFRADCKRNCPLHGDAPVGFAIQNKVLPSPS